MGAWGAGLFSDDSACDVRDHYRELIEDGVDDAEATRNTVEKFHEFLEDPKCSTAIVGFEVHSPKSVDSIPPFEIEP